MANRPTIIDYAATPASEQSVYFDAPVAAWNKDTSDGSPPEPHSGDHSATFPGAFESEESSLNGADLNRTPSVGVPRDPVVRKGPADGDEEEAPTSPVQNQTTDADAPATTKSAHRRSASAAASDSGYGSAGRPQSRASTAIEPIPVVWNQSPSQQAHKRGQALQHSLDDDDGTGAYGGSRPASAMRFRRASSLRSFRSAGPSRGEAEERGSVRTAPSVLRRRRVSLSGGSFASGAGTVGPAASPSLDGSFDVRSRTAELSLSAKDKAKLNKVQVKEGKKVAKIIKAEGKAEKKALDEAVKELADIQKLQKTAIKDESNAYKAYAKALREFTKAELEFLAARVKYERAQADLQAREDAREASKQHAQEVTEMLQEKNREVEWLRAQKAVDDRERGAKIRQLTGKA